MRPRLTALAGFAIALLALSLAGDARSGDTDPPPGPIAPTMKPLDIVEPRVPLTQSTTPGEPSGPLACTYRIDAPGSYYLVENLVGEPNKHGILIADDLEGVTIDLMGFDLNGENGARGGIVARPNTGSITVMNGSVRNWSQGGVSLISARNTRLIDLRVNGNSANGIAAGSGAVITGCAANNNSSSGISVSSRGVIKQCAARDNGANGFSCGSGSVITHCAALINGASGFSIGSACALSECSMQANDTYGVITFGFGGSITDCSIRSNDIDGIRVNNNWTVRGNNCFLNGSGDEGAGIRATGADNRIDANHCFGNRFGVQVSAAGNVVSANTSTANSEANWSIVSGNLCQILVANTSGAIVGNSGGTTPGSTSRWTNYTY